MPVQGCTLPFYLKLKLIKNFVKVKDYNSVGLIYLKNKVSKISDVKIKGVFFGPPITEFIREVKIEDQLSEVKKQHENHSKSLPIFRETIRQKTIVIWLLIL